MNNYLLGAVERKRSSTERKESDAKSMLDILVAAGEEGALTLPQVTSNIFIINFAGHAANAMGVHFSVSPCLPTGDAERGPPRHRLHIGRSSS